MADPQRRERLKRIFDEAQRLPAEARRAFVEQACGGDADLLDEAMATLAAADSADRRGFLATGGGADETAQIEAAGEPAAAAPATPAERPGQKIGRYKLLQQIGEGGMGTVWMAEQTTPLVRRVALKVIKLGMDTRSVIARFEAERQALALMDHPHIARVLDAGATDNGRPYFVMDLVRGRPVTEYADARALTIPERLDLFRQICSAVQHAHQKGVIHRDLKPANVLVSTEDDRPFAKVIDFGIAKAVGQRLTDKTLFTQHGGMVGTLEYMSPEQADASPDVDTRSDVYCLGVMLYELLTGVTPLGRDRLGKAAFDELRRIIREEEPPKPSTRLTTAAASGSLADVARHRKTEPRRLGVLMRGELDWVVMRALEKERGRRYESAGALAEDLRRHTAGEPVEAAPPGAVYRLRKLARRHKGKVAAATAVVLALLVGLIATTAFAAKARREAKRADAEANIAVQQRDSAESATSRAVAAEATALDERNDARLQAYAAAVGAADAMIQLNDIPSARRVLESAPESERGWEWHYLHNSIDESDVQLWQSGSSDDEGVVAYSADGKWLAAAVGGDLGVWDARSHAEVFRMQLGETLYLVDKLLFSPDASKLALACNDSVLLLDIATQQFVATFDVGATPVDGLPTDYRQASCDFDHQGERLVTTSDDGVLREFDLASGKIVFEKHILEARFDGESAIRLTDVVVLPKSQDILTLKGTGTLEVWDGRDGSLKRRFEPSQIEPGNFSERPDVFRRLSIDARGETAVTSTNGALAVWSLLTGERLRTTPDGEYAAALSPDGSRLIYGLSGGGVVVRDVASWEIVGRLTGLGILPRRSQARSRRQTCSDVQCRP